MRIDVLYICKNKGPNQLRGNHAADQRLSFRSETPKTGFLMTLHMLNMNFSPDSDVTGNKF